MAERDPFFKWKHSNVFIIFFWGLALAVLSIGASVEQRDLWFVLAYLFSIAATVWSIGAWLNSDFLRTRIPSNWGRQKRKRATISDWRLVKSWKWSGITALIVLLAGSMVTMRQLQMHLELNDSQGILYPGHNPIPDNACSRHFPNALYVFLGGQVAAIQKFPRPVFRNKGVDVLTIDKNEDGSLAISLDVRSPNGDVIARIQRGKFIVNKNNSLTMHREDWSHLVVEDQKGDIALNVKYFNPKAVWISFKSNEIEAIGDLKDTSPNDCMGGISDGPIMDFRV